MAMSPCDECHRRYLGPARHFYFGLLCGATRYSVHLRLCGPCAGHWNEAVRDHMIPVVDSVIEHDEDASCVACGGDLTPPTHPLFLTQYSEDDRLDHFGLTCDACAMTATLDGLDALLRRRTGPSEPSKRDLRPLGQGTA